MTDLYPNIGKPDTNAAAQGSTPAQPPHELTPEEKGAALMSGSIPANPVAPSAPVVQPLIQKPITGEATQAPLTQASTQASSIPVNKYDPSMKRPSVFAAPETSAHRGPELRDVPAANVLAGETPRIHTFADDVKQALSQDRMSISKIAMEEQKRRDKQADIREVSGRNPRNIALLIVSLILLIGGGATVWFFMTQVGDTQVPIITDDKRIHVTYDNRIDLSFDNTTRAGIAEDISRITTQPLTDNTITAIVYRQGLDLVDPRLFLLRIQSRAPEALVRSLDSQFMLGIYSSKVNAPFILLKSTSYETAYSGMLSWEKDLAVDMDGIIYRKVQALPDASGTISTDGGQYVDRVIANRDARAYIDATGRLLFYYAFVTNELIIIAQNEAVLGQVVLRIQHQNFKR